MVNYLLLFGKASWLGKQLRVKKGTLRGGRDADLNLI